MTGQKKLPKNKQQVKDKTKHFGTTVSYLLGWRKSESRDPTYDCHLRLRGNSLGSLHNCKRSAQLLHSSGKKTMSAFKSGSM